ncbi:MAG: hypothetical protein NWF04_03145 [Candidatus Bathyarchaeota archaeon]|nr:hypothetical protein [Candidatus Bathyarchaeota archaeon]
MELQNLKINWFGLAGGAATLVLLAVSLSVPWWHFSVGDGFLAAEISPLIFDFTLAGAESFTVPLMGAFTLSLLLFLGAGAVIMIIYSLMPYKSYSMRLLSFSYRKPVYVIIFFIVELVGLVLVMKTMLGIDLPLMGSAMIQLPAALTQNMAAVSFPVTSSLEWPFWFAIAVVALCIATRFYHKKLIKPVAEPVDTAI